MEGHREPCLVGKCGEPWGSLVEVQCLDGCIRAERWGASLGLGAEWHCGMHGLVVQSCKMMMTVVAVAPSLQLGAHD